MEHWSNPAPTHQDSFFDVKTSPMLSRTSIATSTSNDSSLVPMQLPTVSSSYDNETLNSLKMGMAKMMSSMERLEQRLNRVEQTTSQILKNQQEVLQVPFISQSELDTARKFAEQMEQDSAVAKQLQAAYNKEVEVRKSVTTAQYFPPNHISMNQIGQCPICGARMASNGELESHVERCLDQFSNDPKKQIAVQDTKKKMETGFFGRTFGIKSTKTTETKVISNSATAPLLSDQDGMMVNPNNYYPPQPFGYPMMMHPQMQQQMMAPPNVYWPNYNGYPMGNSINNNNE